MELDGLNIVLRYRRRQAFAVHRLRRNDLQLFGHSMIAVNEVDVRTCTNTAEKADARPPLMTFRKIQGVPSHVWNLQPRRLDAAHLAGKDAESCSVWRFVAALEKDLQADADAEVEKSDE